MNEGGYRSRTFLRNNIIGTVPVTEEQCAILYKRWHKGTSMRGASDDLLCCRRHSVRSSTVALACPQPLRFFMRDLVTAHARLPCVWSSSKACCCQWWGLILLYRWHHCNGGSPVHSSHLHCVHYLCLPPPYIGSCGLLSQALWFNQFA